MRTGVDRLAPRQTLLSADAVRARVEGLLSSPRIGHADVMATLGEKNLGPVRVNVVELDPNGVFKVRRARVYSGEDFLAAYCVTYRDGTPYPGDSDPGVINKSYTLVGADPLSRQAVELSIRVENGGDQRGLVTASANDLEFWTNQHDPKTMARLLAQRTPSYVPGTVHKPTNVLKIVSHPEQQRLAQALGLPYKD